MPHKFGWTLATALMLANAGFFGFAFETVAQTSQDVSAVGMDMSAQQEQRTRGNAGQRGQGGGQQRNIGQQGGGQQRSIGQQGGGQQRSIQQRSIGQQGGGQQRSIQQRDIGQQGGGQQRSIQQRNIGQQRVITPQRDIGQQRVITRQRDIGQRSITQQRDIGQRRFSNIRGASKTTIAGRNYSVWRGSHRVHRHGHWRTFVGLSALSAIALGSAYYYPYAYIDAPAPYCDGLTEDGCQLQWQAVRTLEGPTEFVCVAYCPWQ
jgi:hypothetical protein